MAELSRLRFPPIHLLYANFLRDRVLWCVLDIFAEVTAALGKLRIVYCFLVSKVGPSRKVHIDYTRHRLAYLTHRSNLVDWVSHFLKRESVVVRTHRCP